MENFYIETYGCQMNEADSEYMASMMASMGYNQVKTLKDADIVIVNTCSIREKAERKVLSFIGRVKPYKEKRKMIIGVCGCVAKQEGKKLIEKAPFIDLVFGPHQINRLHELLEQVKSIDEPVVAVEESNVFKRDINTLTYPGVRALIPIMQGCNNFCTYCIVPYVRGREYSRPEKEILDEIKRLAHLGVKEVMLLGQNVNSYGLDMGLKDAFVDLVEKIANIEGIERIRFTTSHPKDLTDKLIDAFGAIKKLCSHIHLPLQSGSDKILTLMNRRYTQKEYLEKVYKLKNVCPKIAITTDIIVGFPGENEDDFEETLKLYKEVNFDSAFSFKFSSRPGTKAAQMDGKVPEDIKQQRLEILQSLQKTITYEKNKALEGSLLKVLIEGQNIKEKNDLQGRTPCFRIVNFPNPFKEGYDYVGKTIDVKIVRGLKNSLKGLAKLENIK